VEVGPHFFREGDDSQSMYVLRSGRVKIYKSWREESKLLRWMEPGECFGEMALIDFSPRSA
jgi:CRP/FNR family cyclic AMP-dependent transcriptional regulator